MDVQYHLQCFNQRMNPKLKRLWIETTDLCNSRCKMCSIWKTKVSKRNLDYNVLGNPLFKHVDYLLNSGGEPSLCDLKSILLLEHNLLPKATLQVSTNGLLPDRVLDAVESVLESGAIVDVGISLDGIGEEHDQIRGVPGNFEKVNYLVHSLEDFKERNSSCLRVTVGSILTPETARRTDKLLDYAKTNKVAFIWHWPNKSAFYNNDDLNLNPSKDIDILTQAICKAFPDDIYRECWLNSLHGIAPVFDCYALRSFAVLKCNGDIAPCLSLWDKSIGNIMKDDPSKVWNSKEYDCMRERVHDCGMHGCLNSWGFAWSLKDAYFPLLKRAIKRRLKAV